jgi:hypothetical protein
VPGFDALNLLLAGSDQICQRFLGQLRRLTRTFKPFSPFHAAGQ